MAAGIWRALASSSSWGGGEVELAICPSQRCLEASMEEIAGLDHHHAGSAAIRVTVIQPVQSHMLSIAIGRVLGRTAIRLLSSGGRGAS
jgi:hypothetical protein